MMKKYKEIISKAKTCQSNVKKKQKTGIGEEWTYYFAKSILSPKKDIKKISFKSPKKPNGNDISRQIKQSDYLNICKKLVKETESHKQLPNNVEWGKYKLKPLLLKEIFSRILVYYDSHGKLPLQVNANSKIFTEPSETHNEVYDYFVKVFGKFDNTIDGALAKVEDKGYDYYYDDRYSNKQSIDRIKKGLGVNCTDSCHVFYNIMLQLIKFGKYKKVECLHVMCSSGGHVKLRITMNDGTKIIRDPACCISDNSKGIRCVWCTNTPIAVNPSWFLENLNR